MRTSFKDLLSRPVAFVLVAALAVGVSTALYSVHAQSWEEEAEAAAATLTDYASFQYATLTGTTNTINATNVPVTVGKTTTYENLTFQVTVDATGAVKIVSGSQTAAASPVTQSAGFKAGTYLGPNFGSNSSYTGMQIVVSGPGVVAGGFTDWSLSAASGSTASCQYPTSATWYVGSPTSSSNPLYARLKKAGITSTAYSYGTLGSGSCNYNNAGYWQSGALLGVSQTGSAITISSFSYDSTDNSTPGDQITLTLKQ